MRKTQRARLRDASDNYVMTAAVDIPKTAFIPCPALGFKNRRVLKCIDCEFFHGVIDVQEGAPVSTPFDKKYRVACAHPVARRTVLIELEEADDAGPQ
ncbi:MAG: hypothetical protein ACOY9J_03470 [Pseudomonadota bacterium]